jgi:hypothetical protein
LSARLISSSRSPVGEKKKSGKARAERNVVWPRPQGEILDAKQRLRPNMIFHNETKETEKSSLAEGTSLSLVVFHR